MKDYPSKVNFFQFGNHWARKNYHLEIPCPVRGSDNGSYLLSLHDFVCADEVYHQVSNSSPLPEKLAVPTSSSQPAKPVWEVPPRHTKMPPLKAFRLTKELVQQRAKDNVIVVTFGNFAFMDFILTWVKHLTDLGVYNILVGK